MLGPIERAAFAAHKREQARRALSLTPAERLRWLERTVLELKKLQALADLARSQRGPASRSE